MCRLAHSTRTSRVLTCPHLYTGRNPRLTALPRNSRNIFVLSRSRKPLALAKRLRVYTAMSKPRLQARRLSRTPSSVETRLAISGEVLVDQQVESFGQHAKQRLEPKKRRLGPSKGLLGHSNKLRVICRSFKVRYLVNVQFHS